MFMQHQYRLRPSSPSIDDCKYNIEGEVQAVSSSSIKIDIQQYQAMIEHPDLSEKQKHQVVLG